MEANSSTSRQMEIWSNRVRSELDKCRRPANLPSGIKLQGSHLDVEAGACLLKFRCFIPFQPGSELLTIIPLTELELSMPFVPEVAKRGRAQFPYKPPRVSIRYGSLHLPRDIVHKRSISLGSNGTALDNTVSSPPSKRKCVDTHQDSDGSIVKNRYELTLPMLEHWSPSNTLLMVLQELVRVVQQHDPQPIAPSENTTPDSNANRSASSSKSSKSRIARRNIHGNIYRCHEVDTQSSTLRPSPLLLQAGNIVFLDANSLDKRTKRPNESDRDDYVYVHELLHLRELERIAPQDRKSITLFFKSRSRPCRTLITTETDGIVSEIRHMISSTGTRAPSGSHSDAQAGTSLAQLLPFLNEDPADKVKEVSNKVMGKIGKWSQSFSRLFSGEEEKESGNQRNAAAMALGEIDSLKINFLRAPSKQKMTEIIRRYQALAEEYVHKQSNKDGVVERAIEELQIFIEHPATQKVLKESAEYEEANRGIRVGPA